MSRSERQRITDLEGYLKASDGLVTELRKRVAALTPPAPTESYVVTFIGGSFEIVNGVADVRDSRYHSYSSSSIEGGEPDFIQFLDAAGRVLLKAKSANVLHYRLARKKGKCSAT